MAKNQPTNKPGERLPAKATTPSTPATPQVPENTSPPTIAEQESLPQERLPQEPQPQEDRLPDQNSFLQPPGETAQIPGEPMIPAPTADQVPMVPQPLPEEDPQEPDPQPLPEESETEEERAERIREKARKQLENLQAEKEVPADKETEASTDRRRTDAE